ncbi:unnamed protein product [Staurois parvus]|uniref:Uncharacterized protein n=1 Tax=Staurois parvus TaxID=386267 RepID=A0ABN9CXA6_9NEOB|nr:unnamed protein product [Staurois parvus]
MPSISCDSGVQSPPYHVIQVFHIPSISCDSGVSIPYMDTGVYNQAHRHADGFYKH